MARNTRTFTDLDAAFGLNPRTRDVASKVDDNAIRNSISNLIHTKHYERPFQPNVGCQIHNLLFENSDPFTLLIAERAITETLVKFEPRIDVLGVQLTSTDSNDVFIQIEYRIKNAVNTATFTTTFTRVR